MWLYASFRNINLESEFSRWKDHETKKILFLSLIERSMSSLLISVPFLALFITHELFSSTPAQVFKNQKTHSHFLPSQPQPGRKSHTS